MAERIEYPAELKGRPEDQLREMWGYLYRMASTLNVNLQNAGSEAVYLTNDEQILMKQLTDAQQTAEDRLYQPAYNYAEAETLKSLIIKTAQFVKTEVDNYRLILFGEESADGQYGNWNRKKGLRVDVTPDGIKQTYSYAEVIKELKTYEINAKNYIKTGYLRTENMLPVYGVAIGKDVVTFAEDGTETYNDGNKVAELTADELSFYQGSNKVASYKGTEITFYQGGTAKLKIDANGITFLNGSTKLAEILNTAIKFYYAGTLRSQMDTDGITFYDGSTKLAELLASALKFYYNGTLRSQMDNDGISFYDGSTKLAELKGTELSFYQSSQLAAKFQGNKLAFYNNGTEIMSIENGKIYMQEDLGINSGKQVEISEWHFDGTGIHHDADDNVGGTDVVRAIGFAFDNDTMKLYRKTTPNPAPPDNDFSLFFDNSGSVSHGSSLGVEPCIHHDNSYMAIGSLGNATYIWRDIWCEYLMYDTLVQSSSREIKQDIEDMPEIGERLDQLNPVTFRYKKAPDRIRAGLIYEDTIEAMPEICTQSEENKAINYVELIPMLLKEIQSLRARVKALEER